MELSEVAEVGLETLPFSSGNREVSEQGGAKSGAFGDQSVAISSELHEVINRWPTLSTALKAGILAIVRSAK